MRKKGRTANSFCMGKSVSQHRICVHLSKSLALRLIFVSFLGVILLTTPVRGAAENSWTAKAPMPASRSSDIAVAVNGTIYLIGDIYRYGSYLNSSLTPFDFSYNPLIDNWGTITAMPTPRASSAITVYDNKIYAMGGREITASHVLRTAISVNEVYDPSTGTWSTAASMPVGTREAQANTVNGKIYVMGGRTGGQYSTLNFTQIYDPISDSWSIGAPMPYPVISAASAVVDNKIYVIGGMDEYLSSGRDVQFNQIYNTVSDTWSFGTPLPSVTWYSTAAATTGVAAPKMIYVFGGLVGYGGISNQTLAYDPKTDSWKRGVEMPYPSSSPKVAVVNDIIFVVGGKEGVYLLGQSGSGNVSNHQYTPFGYGTPDPTYTPEPTYTSPLPTENAIAENKTQINPQSFPTIAVFAATLLVIITAAVVGVLIKKKHNSNKP